MNQDEPRQDMMLRLYGPDDIDRLDPVSSPRPPAEQISRLFTRQLFTYRAETDLRHWQAIAPVPDLAAEIPSIYNAGVGASYTSYVVHLRPGVLWDTTPARAVTTYDVVRGFKRMANPICRSATVPYFTSTIRGMREFCAGYAAAVSGEDPPAAELAAYQNSHDIPGLLVLDDETLVFELIQPALDFINILALPCASPAPVEYDAFVPDSPELHANLRSNGPYRVSRLTPGVELRLERNPVWQQHTDPVRHQHLDRIEVITERHALDRTAEKINAGEADLPWGTRIADPATDLPSRPDPKLGYALAPYLVFNTRSPNAHGALGRVEVRQAISYAIDKAAVATIVERRESGAVIRIAGSIIPPGNDAYQDIDPYPTPGNRGDSEKCAALLAAAGYPAGLTVTLLHPRREPDRAIARSCAADLTKAGVTARLLELERADYWSVLDDPERAAGGAWDIAVESWAPDWFHHNGRVFLQPLVQTCESRGTANYGRYSNPEVDELIEQALACDEHGVAVDTAWRKAETAALADAAIVPILFQLPAAEPRRSHRVRHVAVLPAIGYSPDLSTVRLDSLTEQ